MEISQFLAFFYFIFYKLSERPTSHLIKRFERQNINNKQCSNALSDCVLVFVVLSYHGSDNKRKRHAKHYHRKNTYHHGNNRKHLQDYQYSTLLKTHIIVDICGIFRRTYLSIQNGILFHAKRNSASNVAFLCQFTLGQRIECMLAQHRINVICPACPMLEQSCANTLALR